MTSRDDRHSHREISVYMVASCRFAYLGGLDERLVTPRTSPRTAAPAGTVGIVVQETGGSAHLSGRLESHWANVVTTFDGREELALWPGDRCFRAISLVEFTAWRAP
jgi:hypothetical protein